MTKDNDRPLNFGPKSPTRSRNASYTRRVCLVYQSPFRTQTTFATSEDRDTYICQTSRVWLTCSFQGLITKTAVKTTSIVYRIFASAPVCGRTIQERARISPYTTAVSTSSFTLNDFPLLLSPLQSPDPLLLYIKMSWCVRLTHPYVVSDTPRSALD